MRIAIIADVFPPLRSSGAVQLRDLSRELARQGHEVTAMIASPGLPEKCRIDVVDGIRVVRLRTPQTKDVNYIRRTIGEFFMPNAMLRNLKKSSVASENWDAVVWYSPTIFLGPIVKALKKASKCPSYLIIRDIFPEWAVDMGLMGRGLPYRFFKTIANYQYSVADVIGVQTPGNLTYFQNEAGTPAKRLEVLHNWLADAPDAGCSINIENTALKGRKIFVYAGNMGIAQGMDALLDLAARLRPRTDIGFLFVGRGSDALRLREASKLRGLDNVLFFDEIDPDEIPGLYAQCDIGLVALDRRHKTHNIPGKFLSYMQATLPVLASINAGNDLVDLIRDKRVGAVATDNSVETLASLAEKLLAEVVVSPELKSRCKALSDEMFSAKAAARQITSALESKYEIENLFLRAFKRAHPESTSIGADETASEYSSKL